jgi:heme/copper-type cytochrome/quinol oxidase subunit 2
MKQIIFSLMYLLVILLTPLALTNSVFAQANLACDGLSSSISDCGDVSSEPVIGDTIKTILDILSLVAGIIAVFMVIIAGTRFITSQGDSGKVASARSAVIYAVVGIIIVAMAQIIVFFVLDETSPAPPATEVRVLNEGETCPRGQVCAQ